MIGLITCLNTMKLSEVTLLTIMKPESWSWLLMALILVYWSASFCLLKRAWTQKGLYWHDMELERNMKLSPITEKDVQIFPRNLSPIGQMVCCNYSQNMQSERLRPSHLVSYGLEIGCKTHSSICLLLALSWITKRNCWQYFFAAMAKITVTWNELETCNSVQYLCFM